MAFRGIAAKDRKAAAMFGSPLARSTVKFAFRIPASTSGAFAVRTRQASSPANTSRTWCNSFLIRQCSRISRSSRTWLASARGRLVV